LYKKTPQDYVYPSVKSIVSELRYPDIKMSRRLHFCCLFLEKALVFTDLSFLMGSEGGGCRLETKMRLPHVLKKSSKILTSLEITFFSEDNLKAYKNFRANGSFCNYFCKKGKFFRKSVSANKSQINHVCFTY
jgi:hypothetical protein